MRALNAKRIRAIREQTGLDIVLVKAMPGTHTSVELWLADGSVRWFEPEASTFAPEVGQWSTGDDLRERVPKLRAMRGL